MADILGEDRDSLMRSSYYTITRNFTKTFTLAEDVQIDGATVVNGILRIDLKRVIPEEDKPVEIKIK